MSDALAPSDCDKDVVMESASNRDLVKAICALAACLPERGHAKESVDTRRTKIDAATSDGGVVMAFPPDFQSDIHEWIRSYRGEVETLANARSLLTKLHKHVSAKTFPMSLSSIKVPSIQFSRAFLSAPAQDADRGTYITASGPVGFEPYVSAAVQALKEGVLKDWVSEKTWEVAFLECRASAAQAITRFEGVVHDKHTQLKAHYDYLQCDACYLKIIKGIELKGAVSHALALAVVTRINSLVLAEEDRKLETAIKKMSLKKPAVAAGSQAPPTIYRS